MALWMTLYARPADLQTALSLISAGPRRILAGGTDLYPVSGTRLDGAVLDITALSALRGISFGDGLRIGAATTWSDIAEATLPPALAGLQVAARQVGGRQVQNVGSIGGNLCNASPAADGVPPLLTLNAEVELASLQGLRRMPLERFITGPRQTARADDEILVAVYIPASALEGVATFKKLGARSYLVISIAMVAVRLVTDGRTVTDLAVAVGACSAVAKRLTAVERRLIGARLTDISSCITPGDVCASLTPIEDVRATAEYRLHAATELVRRALAEVVT